MRLSLSIYVFLSVYMFPCLSVNMCIFCLAGGMYSNKMAIILPTGQWYTPSAIINDAWYCMVLHGIAWYCMVLHCIA